MAMVLCIISSNTLFAQSFLIQPTSVVYDSMSMDSPSYFPNNTYQATVTYSSNFNMDEGPYYALAHFIWSNDPEDIHNGYTGTGYLLQVTPLDMGASGSRTEQYTLSPFTYLPMEDIDPRDGIYFGFYYSILDENDVVVQVYSSPTYTWRFPSQDITTSVEGNESLGYNMYPNPATDSFRIDGLSKGQLIIMNNLGQVVLTSQMVGDETVDVSSLPAGSYAVSKVTEEGGLKFFGRLQKL